MLAEAGQILGKLKTMSITRAAREMNMCRDTLYARLKLISRQIPDVDLVRVIHFERLESMFEGLEGRADAANDSDYARLRAEQRQVLARQSALLRVEQAEPAVSPENDEPDPWVAGARDEADDELTEVESELRARRNGGSP